MKLDVDSESKVSDKTGVTSIFKTPRTRGATSYSSSKLELQINFLAKELELERQRREKL